MKIGNQSHGKPRRAQEAIADYKKDKACTVYFDPNDPESAVLENGIQWSNVFFFLLPIGLFAVGILSAIFVPYAIRLEEAKKKANRCISKGQGKIGCAIVPVFYPAKVANDDAEAVLPKLLAGLFV